jgi:Uma2 family endonuclease
MNIAQRQGMTVADYLAWGDALEEQRRSELINGQIVTMSPESAAHNRIKGAAYLTLIQAVKARGLPCEVFLDGMTVPIDTHTAYEPDVLVHCGAPIPPRQLTVPAPLIVVKIISPSSRRSDTGSKLTGYFSLPSIQHYLVIDPEARAITHHARAPNGSVAGHTAREGTLRLDPPGIELRIADLFG